MDEEQNKKINNKENSSIRASTESDQMSSPLKELEEKLAKCEKEKEEYLNGWKRAKADYINYQKDEAKRAEEMIKFSAEILIKDLLSVLDSFDLALINNANEQFKKGIEIICSQFEKTLNKYGLEPIKTEGEKFNPGIHEAIEEIVSGKEPGTVAEELVKGWKLHGKVIRPAKVKIAKSK